MSEDNTSDIVDRVTRGWPEGSPEVLLGIACREIVELRGQRDEAHGKGRGWRVSDINTLIERLTELQRHEFALACARRVPHLMTDPRSVAALNTRERWLRGEAGEKEITAAGAAAWAAAWAASDALDAARSAAWAAAWAASDALDAARSAAGASAWAAALAAAGAAANAAADVALDAAREAAWDAERAWQREELERMLKEGGGA